MLDALSYGPYTPEDAVCPITCQIMRDPVSVASGYIYDRSSITEWFQRGYTTNPSTNEVLANLTLTPKTALKKYIQQHYLPEYLKNNAKTYSSDEFPYLLTEAFRVLSLNIPEQKETFETLLANKPENIHVLSLTLLSALIHNNCNNKKEMLLIAREHGFEIPNDIYLQIITRHSEGTTRVGYFTRLAIQIPLYTYMAVFCAASVLVYLISVLAAGVAPNNTILFAFCFGNIPGYGFVATMAAYFLRFVYLRNNQDTTYVTLALITLLTLANIRISRRTGKDV